MRPIRGAQEMILRFRARSEADIVAGRARTGETDPERLSIVAGEAKIIEL